MSVSPESGYFNFWTGEELDTDCPGRASHYKLPCIEIQHAVQECTLEGVAVPVNAWP